MLQGQIEGGIVMALGNCLTEVFIIEGGVPWTRLLARYRMPSIKHAIDAALVGRALNALTAACTRS
mgnify:FL=1